MDRRWDAKRDRSSDGARLLAVLRFLALAAAIGSCAFAGPPSPSPDPEVVRSIDARTAAGLRADKVWVETVIADPASVAWNGIRVSPEEAALMDDRRLHEVMGLREGVGLPADEANVRALLVDRSTVTREGRILMSPAEAEAWDARFDDMQMAGPALTEYGRAHPEDWADIFVKDDGTVVTSFSGHIETHRSAIAAMFVPGTVRIEVRQVRWSLRELEPVRASIRKEITWFGRQAIQLEGGGVRPAENMVVIDVWTKAPRPGIEDEIIDHLDAEGKMRVDATVRPPLNLGTGSLTITVLDLAGKPVPEVDCFVRSDVPGALVEDVIHLTDERGVCRWDFVAATGYRVEIWRGFEWGFLGAGHAQVPDDGEGKVTIMVAVN